MDLTGDRADSPLRESELTLLYAASQLILDKSHTLADTLQFIVTETQRVLNASHVDILFQYADGLRTEVSSDDTEIGHFVPFERQRYFLRAEKRPADEAPERGVLTAELTLDGETIGVINVEATPDNGFDTSHRDFVHAVARVISIAISHAALFDEDNFRAATDRLLVAASSGNSDVVMRQVLDRILATLDSLTFVKPDAAEILFADPQDAQSLVVAYSTNSADIGIRVDAGSSVCGEAFRQGKTVLAQQASEHHDYRPILEGMPCEMAIPIVLGSRFPIGVLNLESSRENAFSTVGQVLAERFVRQVVNAIAMTKIRADLDSELQDQLMVLAADQMLNSVHRINNYVGSIRAVVADLLDDLDSPIPPDPSDLTERLRMIGDNAERALEIPDELRRRIGTAHESADVNAQVEAGLSAVRIPKHITLLTDLAPGLPNIPCTALDLVVENLLLNAVKAMQDRPGSLQVTTWLDQRRPMEPFIVITVADTGIGMTDDELAHLFEPRRAGRRRGGGLGFGMMWVRNWVRRAYGLIDIESQPGVGTTVNIRFQIDPLTIDHTPAGGELA